MAHPVESVAAEDYTGLLESQLTSTRNLLNELLIPNSSKNNLWTRLFSQQLERLINYYHLFPPDFWVQLHDDILYILEKSNREQNENDSWTRFLERMRFESELEQRQLQFYQIYGERKSLHELFNENQEIVQTYLHKCISLHSKVKVQGLMRSTNDLFHRDYMLSDDLLTKERQKHLEEKLKCIEIPFDCSNNLLNNVYYRFCEHNQLSTTSDNNLNTFLPSVEPLQVDKNSSEIEILTAIRDFRWLVILGDPGSAKTTLLRWITYILAEAAYCGHREINLTERFGYKDWGFFSSQCHIPVRIPILIRIGEFAEWLQQHQTKTIIDYIGEHTWFNECYCLDDNDGSVLKEFIYHGHAFILLDGLDEIPEVRQRSNIIDHVHKFIDEYVRAPNFISAFDDSTFTVQWPYTSNNIKLLGIPLPYESGGNQIVITSRLVGYQLYPLIGHSIVHSSLLLINHEKAREFVYNWIAQVEKVVLETLFDEGIKPDEEAIRTLTQKRSNLIKKIFENASHLLMSTPLLLSLICMLIFRSSDEFNPKTRIEIYDRVVQSVLYSYPNEQSNISKSVIINFLIDLASYLHLQSPTGIIDAFDMKMLCYFSLRQQGLGNNNVELHPYVDGLISLLNFNAGIVVERSLLVFSFLHLSFEEYFVAQSFLRGSSTDKILKRILTFLIKPRFRESILLSIAWISWKWSSDDYDQFCYELVTSNKDDSIPYGALLFFEALNDLQKLPSNSIIYTALNSLLDHSSNIIASTYLSLNLFKLDNDMMVEWINLCYQNDQKFVKFCQCLLNEYSLLENEFDTFHRRSLPYVIHQQLEFFHDMNNKSTNFLLDQILRKTSSSFIDQLSSFFSRHDIHPLILSIIIAVCNGINITDDEDERILNISFTPHEFYRKSSILPSIIEYLQNDKEPHSIKIPNLVKHYENVLEKFSSRDTSLNIVDTLIALICLQSVSQISIYEKYNKYPALSMALDRLKWTWFYLRKSYNDHMFSFDNELFQSLVISQSDLGFPQVNNQCTISASLCIFIWDKIQINNLSNFHDSCDSFKWINFCDMTEDIYSFDEFQAKPFLLLSFIPQSLQELYNNMLTNETDSLPLIVLLSDCLIHLDNLEENHWNVYLGLSLLQPISKKYNMENYLLVILWKKMSHDKFDDNNWEAFLDKMKDHIKVDQSFIDRPKNWEELINIERERICQAENTIHTDQRDLQFFTASICLARLYQVHQDSQNNETNNVNLSSIKINFAIRNIFNPILRIIAQSIILNMKDPFIFNEEQTYQLQIDMIGLLQSLLPNLSLLKSTFLFIRCHAIRQVFPVPFQHMARIIGEKLNKSSITEDREIAFIALRQLNNSDLSYYLSQFVKQTISLSNILHFNSTIFYHYFMNQNSFNSQNNVLLSILYLIELIFDAQILRIYTNNQKPNLLWKEQKCGKIMTFQIAEWITNYLKISNEEDICQIIRDVTNCLEIERKALPLVQTWLNYRINKELQFFAHYAALQLIINGSNNSEIIAMIDEMFDIDCEFRFKSILECLIKSSSVDLIIIRRILIVLNQHVHYSLPLFLRISRKQLLELVLNLELERIISNRQRKSFLSMFMFIDCSNDLYDYLEKYLYQFMEINCGVEQMIKEEYLAIIFKWIIKNLNENNYRRNLFIYVLTFLHNQRYSRIQKAILYSLNLTLTNISQEKMFIYNDIIIHLEKVICSYNKYQEDVISICLLTYGNYLIQLNHCDINKNISNEIKESLITLFQNSSSLYISIRAGCCLIFIEQSKISLNTIPDWFENKWKITTEKMYSILLQQMLYKHINLYSGSIDQTVKYIEINSDKLIDVFIQDFYNDLNSKHYVNYNLFDCTPYYISIASYLFDGNIDRIVHVVRKSSFGEENFKNELYYYFCHTNNVAISGVLIKLYAAFSVLTLQLVNMLKWTGDWDWDYDKSSKYLKHIRNVSDRTVIDQLFELFNLILFNTYSLRFSNLLKLILQLAENHIISALEIQERLSLLLQYNNIQLIKKKYIVNTLLNLTFLKNELSLNSTMDLVTENIIDKHFQNVDNKSPLCIRKNHFFTNYRKNFQ